MKYLLVTGFILFTLICNNGFAERKFTIGVEELKFYPVSDVKENRYCGYFREFLDLFAQSRGYKFEYKPRPIKRLLNEFSNQKLDFKMPDNPNWSSSLKKGQKIIYSGSILDYIDGIFVLPNNKGDKSKLRIVGTILGFTPKALFPYIRSGSILIYENSNYEGLIRQAILKRVDGIYVPVIMTRYYLANVLKKPNILIFDNERPYTKGSYRLSTIKHPKIINEIDLFIERNREKINLLKEKYKVIINVKGTSVN